MNTTLNQPALDQLFTQARTHSAWQDKPVSAAQLEQLYQLAAMGPTSVNMQPARFVFVQSPAAKARLKPHLSEGNVEKTMAAPVTVIVGMDTEFYEKLPVFFPHADTKPWFVGKPDFIASSALRNSSLQGAYLILAARALGLDTGPMSGFNNAGVDAEFFSGTAIKSNFLINLGFGDASHLHPRGPRATFAEAAQII